MKYFIQLFCLLFSFNSYAVIRYVTPAGAGLQNGTAWANAFPGTSLQAAINAAAPGDEVWVAAGTYFTTTHANREIYFSMRNGVAVYGSFTGTETLLSQRVFTCGFSSVLSAEIGVPGIADNSYHVISNGSLNNTSVLDGFTITGGHANFDAPGNDSRSHGGGMINLASNGGLCSPTVRNCLFINNTAVFGGGMFNNGFNTGNANPILLNCIFSTNAATNGGGGMDNFGYAGNASPSLTNCIFYSNTAAQRAGAMYCWGGGNGNASPAILNSVFVNNSSVDGGGLVCDRTNTGGGSSGTANPTIRNSIFWGNTASAAGPQFFTLGSGTFTATYTLIDITNQNPPHSISGAGTGNIFSAPSFLAIADADGADNCWLTSDDGLQLQAGSAGIDAADNTALPPFDIRYYNRISNMIADAGPYELNSSVLPVHFGSFYGKAIKGANLLFWATESEQNSHTFIVERSIDGVNFQRIGEVAASGYSHVKRNYRYTDNQFTGSKNFYRLKNMDVDGRNSLSAVIMLENRAVLRDIFIYPNPVKDWLIVNISNPVLFSQELLLINSNGQLMERVPVKNNSIRIYMADKPAGIYMLISSKQQVLEKIYKTD